MLPNLANGARLGLARDQKDVIELGETTSRTGRRAPKAARPMRESVSQPTGPKSRPSTAGSASTGSRRAATNSRTPPASAVGRAHLWRRVSPSCIEARLSASYLLLSMARFLLVSLDWTRFV